MDIKEDKKKYQAANYINEDRLQDKKYIKKRLQSKIIFFVVCSVSVAFILAIIGCFIYRHVTGPSLEKMMSYMEEKYGEEFEVEALNTQVWTATYTGIQVKSAKFPEEVINVITYKNGTKRIYEDNYISILRRNDFNAAYQDQVNKVYKKSLVFATSISAYLTLPSEIDQSTEINDILSNPDVRASVSIYVEDDSKNKDEQIDELRLLLKEKKWLSTITIYYVKEDLLNNISWENRNDIMNKNKNCYLYGKMIIARDFEIKSLRWEVY